MCKCARTGCNELGTFKCSGCHRESYCGTDCQKGDWKGSHKLICNILKKLSRQLQSFSEVERVIKETRDKRIAAQWLKARVLNFLISYAKYQYGDRVVGKTYREWSSSEYVNGEILIVINRLDNYQVEINILSSINDDLITIYEDDESLSSIARDNLRLPFCKIALELLHPWNAYPDLNSSPRQIDNLDTTDKNYQILSYLYKAEDRMAHIQRRKNMFHLAGIHCQRGLFYARLYDGIESDKINILCGALKSSHDLRALEGNCAAALLFAQEAYDCVTAAHNPVHPEVQGVASMLIECLYHKGDIHDAKLLAQVILDNLMDPLNGMNQQSMEVAMGYANLSKVISRGFELDIQKAEELARALRCK